MRIRVRLSPDHSKIGIKLDSEKIESRMRVADVSVAKERVLLIGGVDVVAANFVLRRFKTSQMKKLIADEVVALEVRQYELDTTFLCPYCRRVKCRCTLTNRTTK